MVDSVKVAIGAALYTLSYLWLPTQALAVLHGVIFWCVSYTLAHLCYENVLNILVLEEVATKTYNLPMDQSVTRLAARLGGSKINNAVVAGIFRKARDNDTND